VSVEDSLLAGNQKALDSIVVNHTVKFLLEPQTAQYHRARLLASAAAHSGDWLHAVPISACGLRLDNEALRVAVGLRFGAEICQPTGAHVVHQLILGAQLHILAEATQVDPSATIG